MTEQYFIGIDISKANLDVYVHPEGRSYRYPNTKAGRRNMMAGIQQLPGTDLIIFEASGGYERPLRQSLSQSGWPHACVQPGRVHAFLRAQGYSAKTDRLDAKALALFGASGLARPCAAQDETRLALRDMTRSLAVIRKHNAMIKNQIEKLGANADAHAALQAILEAGVAQEQTMLEAIKAHVKAEANLHNLVDCLSSMPGVGFYTACLIAAELPEIGTCSKAEIAALTGTAPYTRQSGQWTGQAAIKGGRHHARKALYMAAVTASRCNPVFSNVYQKMRQRGKSFKVAIVAIMRKMAIAMNAMAKNQKLWDEQYA